MNFIENDLDDKISSKGIQASIQQSIQSIYGLESNQRSLIFFQASNFGIFGGKTEGSCPSYSLVDDINAEKNSSSIS